MDDIVLYPLVDDSLVLTLEFTMKQKDFRDYEVVLALFTISTMADGAFDEIAECDLPDPLLCSAYRAVRSSISSLIKHIEQYRDEKIDTFLSACED